MLETDIKGCFDNISHEYILKNLGKMPGRELIKQWLKAGYVENEMFQETESGTPQGGIISPLLANIALDGLDNLKKYFRTHQGDTCIFFAKIPDRRAKPKYIHITKARAISIERQVKVKDTASPDDPKMTKYWKDRKTKDGKSYSTDGKLRSCAQQQRWKCPVCGEHLFNGEELETHHKVRVKDGGTDDRDNLIHLHKTCHHHLHSGKRPQKQEA